MTTKDLAQLLGKTIRLKDDRTAFEYKARITDAKEGWGRLRIQVNDYSRWFEPTTNDLRTAE